MLFRDKKQVKVVQIVKKMVNKQQDLDQEHYPLTIHYQHKMNRGQKGAEKEMLLNKEKKIQVMMKEDTVIIMKTILLMMRTGWKSKH